MTSKNTSKHNNHSFPSFFCFYDCLQLTDVVRLNRLRIWYAIYSVSGQSWPVFQYKRISSQIHGRAAYQVTLINGREILWVVEFLWLISPSFSLCVVNINNCFESCPVLNNENVQEGMNNSNNSHVQRQQILHVKVTHGHKLCSNVVSPNGYKVRITNKS